MVRIYSFQGKTCFLHLTWLLSARSTIFYRGSHQPDVDYELGLDIGSLYDPAFVHTEKKIQLVPHCRETRKLPIIGENIETSFS